MSSWQPRAVGVATSSAHARRLKRPSQNGAGGHVIDDSECSRFARWRDGTGCILSMYIVYVHNSYVTLYDVTIHKVFVHDVIKHNVTLHDVTIHKVFVHDVIEHNVTFHDVTEHNVSVTTHDGYESDDAALSVSVNDVIH